MVHLTILLIICFIVQTVGYFYLRKNLKLKNEEGQLNISSKRGLSYILIGLIIQLIIICSQVVIYFLVARHL